MRVISQDGTKDIPYEIAMIDMCKHCTEEKYMIYAQSTFCGADADDNFVLMAEYSAEEKAVKAMNMLRNEYHGYKVEETYPDGTEYYHPIFQFPKDDELEAEKKE